MSDFFTIYKQRLRARDPKLLLLTINVAVFLLFTVLTMLKAGEIAMFLSENVFIFKTNPVFFATHPWTILTSIFTHFSFSHLFFNMLMFYFVAQMFVHFFNGRKLVWIYLLGGLTGNLLELIVSVIVYGNEQSISVVGASGSVMAIFIAIAIYQPHFKVNLFGAFEIKIIYIAAIYFVSDFARIGFDDGIAHLAHLGGALIGFLSARNVQSPSNILNRTDRLWKKITTRQPKKPKPIFGGKPFTDEEFNATKKANQEKTDAILDKISKRGYEGLTAAEKDFLFNQSKRK